MWSLVRKGDQYRVSLGLPLDSLKSGRVEAEFPNLRLKVEIANCAVFSLAGEDVMYIVPFR